MRFPIPGFRAEEAAQDFAGDVRELGRKALPLKEAIERGEANEQERRDYSMLCDQILSMSQTVFVCSVTQREYRVGDYVTEGMRVKAKLRAARIYAGYLAVKRALLH